jgi:hypothetical protein
VEEVKGKSGDINEFARADSIPPVAGGDKSVVLVDTTSMAVVSLRNKAPKRDVAGVHKPVASAAVEEVVGQGDGEVVGEEAALGVVVVVVAVVVVVVAVVVVAAAAAVAAAVAVVAVVVVVVVAAVGATTRVVKEVAVIVRWPRETTFSPAFSSICPSFSVVGRDVLI